MPDQVIQFTIRADTAQGKASVDAFTRSLSQTGPAAEKSISGFRQFEEGLNRRVAQTAKYAAAAAVLAMAGIAAASVKMAVEAVESENLFDVSMGRMGKAARDWSNEVSAALGMNAFEVRKSVGTFNVMLSSMGLAEDAAYDMAKGLTQLSYDMASFYNLSPDIAFQKLQSGISGEIEPLKRLGIIVNEETVKQAAYASGIAKVGQELTNTQKIQARYIAIMQQTAVAQGDMARTIDSPANAMRVLQSRSEQLMIQLGTALIPTLQGVIVIMGDLIRWLQSGAENLQLVAKAVILPIQAFQILRGGILGLITLFYAEINALVDLGATVVRTVDMFNLFPGVHKYLQEGVEGSRAKMLEFGVAGLKVQDEIASLQGAVDNLSGAIGSSAHPVRGLSTDVDKLAEKHKKAAKAVDEHAEDLKRFRSIFVEVRPELDATDQAYQRYLDALLQITQVQDPLRNAELQRLNQLRLTKEQATATAEAVQKINESMVVPPMDEGFIDVLSQAPPLLNESQLRMLDLSNAARSFGVQMSSAFTQMVIYGKGFGDVMKSLLVLIAEAIIKAYVFKSIAGSLSGSSGFLGVIGSFFGGLGGVAGEVIPAGGGGYGAFQTGGRPPMGELSLVGERGPEWFVPDRPGTIVPIGQGRALGPTTVINNYVDARGADAAVEYRLLRAQQASEARAIRTARLQMQQAALRS
ncbi:MAG: hypothetical protein PHE55_05205 [Methylococcaceae bacterium]|nr:hypothetical protein [Methylococcaceae bacterium]